MVMRTIAAVAVFAATLLAAILLAAPGAASPGAGGQLEEAHVRLARLTKVCDKVLPAGDYMVTHDDAKMDRGEPCTTIYRVEGGRPEAIVSFHCIPAQRARAQRFRMVTRPYAYPLGGLNVEELVEYQFAGETEAHGVPRAE